MKAVLYFIIPLFISLHLLSSHLDTFITNHGFYATFLMIFSCFLSSFLLSFFNNPLYIVIYAGVFYATSIYSHTALAIYCSFLFVASIVGIWRFCRNHFCNNKSSMFLHLFIISIILLLVDFEFRTMSIPFFKIVCVLVPLVLFYVWRLHTVLFCAYRYKKEMQQKK